MVDVKILDVTIRDGSYVNNFQFTIDDVRNIINGLEEAGIELIEVGHGVGLGASEAGYGLAAATDEEYLRIASETARKAKLVTMILPGIGDIRLIELAAKYGIYLLRIAPNVTEAEKAKPYVEEARRLGLKTSVNLLKTYLVSTQEMVDIAKRVEDFGADIIYLVDSAGGMIPEETTERVSALIKALKIPVGFHGHNNISLAQANAVSAVRSGATYIDTSLCGMGRSGGNVQTEVFAGFLIKEGYPIKLNLIKLLEVAEKYVKPLMPYQQGIDQKDFLYGYAQLHSSFEKLILKFSKLYDIDPYTLILVLGESKLVTPVEDRVHEVIKDYIKKNKSSYYGFIFKTEAANIAQEQVFEIIRRAGCTKKTAFIITSFPIFPSDGQMFRFSPIRESSTVVYGNVQVANIDVSEDIAKAVDGLVDAVIVDSEIKIDALKYLVTTIYEVCKKSKVFTYKDIDVWAESVESLVSALLPSLYNKRVFLVGDGALLYKLSVRFSEQGAFVYVNINNKEKIKALNLLSISKRKEIEVCSDIYNDCDKIDLLIGCDINSSCIDERLMKSIGTDTIVIDAARGTISSGALAIAKKRGINIYGFDMRLGFAGLITRLIEADEFLNKIRGERIVEGIRIVAGGVIGEKGDIVVDSISNPTAIIGVADGTGKILHNDSEFRHKLKKIKELLFKYR